MLSQDLKRVLQSVIEQRQHTVKDIPQDLLKFVIRSKLYNLNAPFTVREMVKDHKEMFNDLRIDKHINKKNLKFAIAKNLHFLTFYKNGDMAWYSFNDGHIYNQSHDTGDFTSIDGRRDTIKSFPYHKWMQLVRAGKIVDVWKR